MGLLLIGLAACDASPDSGANDLSTNVVGGDMSVQHGSKDLCKRLVTDLDPHPMTTLAKPALGGTVVDAEFGTTIRRITQSSATAGNDAAIVPLYSTVSAWNADESLLLLYDVGGRHRLYDGKTYQFLRTLDELSPPDLEQVYWHTSDPDILLLVEDKTLIRYHVAAAQKESVDTFSFCTESATAGGDPMFTSYDSNRIGLKCGDQVFIYDIPTKTVLGRKSFAENPAQMSASGKLAYLSDSGRVTDTTLNVLRKLDLAGPDAHASMALLPGGIDTWNGAVYDDGPMGNTDIGILVSFELATGNSHVVIGPKTGYPYPPDGHISMLAYKQPGWAVVSTIGDPSGKGLLDSEILVANTVDNTVCRAGRHRSFGKGNTHLMTPYWAEPHAVPSPSGTRIAFGSDWGNGDSVDTYILELPSYTK